MTRTVLIGKGRRVTIDELQSVALYDGLLEMHNPNPSEENGPAQSSSSTSDLELALSSLTRKESTEVLSAPATRACLTLLALTVSQGRIIPSDTVSFELASAIVNIVKTSKKTKASSSRLCLPSDPTQFASALVVLLPAVNPSGTDGQTTLHPSVTSSLPESITIFSEQNPVAQPFLVRNLALAIGCLSAGRARSLSRCADGIAALSAEQVQIDPAEYYADGLFDTLRPHRGLVTSAGRLRAILEGSRFATKSKTKKDKPGKEDQTCEAANASTSDEDNEGEKENGAFRAVATIPQYHGPAVDIIASSCRTLELEMNCSEPNAKFVLDNTVAGMAMSSAMNGVITLLDGSKSRIETDADKKSGGGKSDFPMDAISGDILSMARTFESAVSELDKALQEEANIGLKFVNRETTRAEEEAKKKEAAKAAKAAELAARNAAEGGGEEKDEFEGLSEQQKAKILKKRAEKEAKAAAKKAAKSKGGTVSIFGTGTGLICAALAESACELDEATINKIETVIEKLLSGGVQRKPKIPKGTRDYLPDQMMIRDKAFQIIRRVFKSHGAVEIDTPVFELKETLTGKYGEDSKLIYDLADQGGELLALRYDLTVPFARFLALNSVGNIKRFHIGKVYRRDQPALSRGRYREFYQCDFDIAGTYGRMVPDAECVSVVCDILDALPIGNFGIKLNHRRLLDAILDICGVPSDKFRTICSAVDKLDKEPWDAVKREMVDDKGLKPEVADKIGEFVLQRGEPWEMYKSLMDSKKFGTHSAAKEAMEDLRIMFEYLEAMDKLKFVTFDLSLARGLDYYTGVIYEAFCMSGNTQVGSIGGGGRYDNLVSMFQEAGKNTPCVGVSVGIERVFTLMEARLREEQGGSIRQPNVDVLVATAGNNMMKERMKLTKVLWDAKISAEFSQQDNPKLTYEIKNALDRGIPFMAIVGEDEVKSKTCKVKDLKARTEDTIPLSELVATLRKKGVVPVGCEFAAEMLEEENGNVSSESNQI